VVLNHKPGLFAVFLSIFMLMVGAAGPVRSMTLIPEELMYEPYLASPTTPRLKLGRITVDDARIPETGETRWELKAGRTVGLFRFNGVSQINVLGGFMASFDVDQSTDSVGWDGLFGAQYVRRLSGTDRLKLEYFHQSAHRGDEYILRTGRGRIDYTRQELNLGLSRHWIPQFRTYAEAGWGFTLRNPDVQEAGRFQTGFEYGIRELQQDRSDTVGWFVAGDFESYEERDWSVDSTLSAGFYGFRNRELWRVGLEYRDGRVPYGEFAQSDETYLGLAVWNDAL
jgi:hypothetical protein